MGRGGATAHRGSEPDIGITTIGIYGWRKRCLYFLVLLLLVLIIINLALTVWILKVLDFSIYGLGNLKLSEDGVRITGDVEFLQPVYASQVHANHELPLVFNSKNNITFNARNRWGNITGQLVVGSTELTSFNERFIIYDSQENILFDASDELLTIGDIVRKIKFTVSEGVAFQGPVQANTISSNEEDVLRLESPIGDINLDAAKSITLFSREQLLSSCFGDMSIVSKTGKIILDSSDIRISGLTNTVNSTTGAYQLCVCPSGRLFLTNPQDNCEPTYSQCN